MRGGFTNISARATVRISDSQFVADSVGLKVESTFRGRTMLHIDRTVFERSGLLLSGGVDSWLNECVFQSCRLKLVSSCTASVSKCQGKETL